MYYKEKAGGNHRKGTEASKVQVKAKGEGGIDEMKQYLGKNEILFGLLALFIHDTQKFVFITWVGEDAPSFDRARVVIQKVFVSELFQVRVFPTRSSTSLYVSFVAIFLCGVLYSN